MAKRSYSDKEKGEALAVLDANGGNVSLTAKQTKVPRATLQEWVAGRVSAEVPDIRQEKKEELRDIFERLTRKGLAHLESNIASGKFGEVSLAVCQWVDKMQLLGGKPTAITENRGENRAWAEQQLAEMMREFNLTREAAIALAKENAPTVAEWLM